MKWALTHEQGCLAFELFSSRNWKLWVDILFSAAEASYSEQNGFHCVQFAPSFMKNPPTLHIAANSCMQIQADLTQIGVVTQLLELSFKQGKLQLKTFHSEFF